MSQHSTIPELRSHIDDISSAIEAQELLLRDLYGQRSDAQQKLNSFLDPMARLPLELQSHIFLQVSVDSHSNPEPNGLPMVLLTVSRMWRDIALSTPRLWCRLEMDSLPRGPDYSRICDIWLSRARSLPLSLTLSGSPPLEQSVQDLVKRYRDQVASLTLKLSPDENDNMLSLHLIFGPDETSRLSSLKILSIAAHEVAYFGGVDEWLDVLRAAPALSSLTLHNTLVDDIDEQVNSQPLYLPSLETLHLGQFFTWIIGELECRTSCLILRHVTLPALKTLSLSNNDIDDGELLAFFSRSAPPLESLHATIPFASPEPFVSRFLGLIPTLTHLKLCAVADDGAGSEPFLPFLELLGNSSDILPKLCKIAFHMDIPVTVDHGKVLRMLEFRVFSCPVRLEGFSLVFPNYGAQYDYTRYLPNPHVQSSLRKLVDDGLDIHWGSAHQNLL
ncbi:hypothetical protein R3P38DRAFT_2960719 [Favolaschia claudopus]|uniref:F-box domain-containing protein n=1 Tax=Favolaschia claudopus TaxID=2862362 RepID=A0AAW0B878_9AGAR